MSEPFHSSASAFRFHWRRVFQYRLRTILILTTIIAIWLGWWSHKARQQQEAVAALERAKAMVFYDCHHTNSQYDLPPGRPPYWPIWMVRWLGVDYFACVHTVSLSESATDEEMKYVGMLTKLRHLDASNARISDFGLKYLEHLTNLSDLYLERTQVTDQGMRYLQNLRQLRMVTLDNTEVGDAGLQYLHGLKSLESVELEDSKVTAAGAAQLQRSLPKRILIFCKGYEG